MFACNRNETRQIMEGKATGVARRYPGGCPHVPGSELWLTSDSLDRSGAGRHIPFAKIQVVSVRPGTVGQFRRDPMIAEIDGYANGAVWFGQMSQMYKGIKDTDNIVHLKFRVIQMDKEVGMRGDVAAG